MVTVVKIGGARAVDPAGALADVASLVDSSAEGTSAGSQNAARSGDGEQVVVVHGGSTAVDDTLESLGEDPEYVETPSGVVGRFTDERTMEVFSMVLPGKLNTDLVVGLQNAGVNAVGLSGVDGGLLKGPRKSAVRVVEDDKQKIRRGDHSGTVKQVDSDLLDTLLAGGYTPVVTVPMLAKDSEQWLAVNSDADRAAAAVAGALDADLVLLTDVPGVLADLDDPDSVIDVVDTPTEYESLTDAAEGFMTRKVMAATEALEGGATSVTIGDANADAPVSAALEGTGTTVLPGALSEERDTETAEAEQ
ncbi:acetylglutamate/acetylaminoadipate kinase [Halomarina rubra]|uniref:Putative [LysW]-aminoadipate/[LysW]-glutamate kinase n=1 Tax=Halomarina rubra TaxID=2071873 RepID=A0ABD6AWW0_9EURY|nr:acetylglutamate/acetylaminoadipate kinase [Halomarina rubra]